MDTLHIEYSTWAGALFWFAANNRCLYLDQSYSQILDVIGHNINLLQRLSSYKRE